jgi:hypothetical protein
MGSGYLSVPRQLSVKTRQPLVRIIDQTAQKFFGSFFQKRTAFAVFQKAVLF